MGLYRELDYSERLPKNDFVWLIQRGCILVVRYLEICWAWDTVSGIIDELDMRQAYIEVGGKLKEPKAAYL